MPDDAERGPAFARDELIAGRYRIVRFIARGGMGEVYEAEDLELGVRVALKTVRADAAGPQPRRPSASSARSSSRGR